MAGCQGPCNVLLLQMHLKLLLEGQHAMSVPLAMSFFLGCAWRITKFHPTVNDASLRLPSGLVCQHCTVSIATHRFELVAPPRFGLVCLRLKGVGNDGNRALLAAINNAGEARHYGATVHTWHGLGQAE